MMIEASDKVMGSLKLRIYFLTMLGKLRHILTSLMLILNMVLGGRKTVWVERAIVRLET
jgi:hypothetical protein